MVFHGAPRIIPREIAWNSHEIATNILGHGTQRQISIFNGCLFHSLATRGFHGVPFHSMASRRSHRRSPWRSLDVRGMFYGAPYNPLRLGWVSMAFHGMFGEIDKYGTAGGSDVILEMEIFLQSPCPTTVLFPLQYMSIPMLHVDSPRLGHVLRRVPRMVGKIDDLPDTR